MSSPLFNSNWAPRASEFKVSGGRQMKAISFSSKYIFQYIFNKVNILQSRFYNRFLLGRLALTSS